MCRAFCLNAFHFLLVVVLIGVKEPNADQSRSKSESKGSKSKVKPKSKSKPKSSKAMVKPKAKPKPKPNNLSMSYSMNYSYSQHPIECRCKVDFSDEMCGWCFAGDDKCINVSCLDKCCTVKECKCDDHVADVCKRCAEEGKECPDKECADKCCSLVDAAVYPDTGEGHDMGPIKPEDGENSEREGDDFDKAKAAASITSQYVPSVSGNNSYSPGVSYGLFAAVLVGSMVGIAIRLKKVRIYIVRC
jgi:hypothetical protein